MEFCKSENIIGIGWSGVKSKVDDWNTLYNTVQEVYKDWPKNDITSTFQNINAIREMRKGDLIWTRIGGKGSEYYLCKVGEKTWKDRIIEPKHIDHDICQFVSANWVYIGKEDKVPGKVINSFSTGKTAQRVRDIEVVSKYIWDLNCNDASLKYNDYSTEKNNNELFWNCIESEDLESLVLMYIQFLGYYIVSTTLKKSSPTTECIMISRDGKTKCYQQVKRNTELKIEDYEPFVKENEIMYLFTTSEEYGQAINSKIKPIYKTDLEKFIRNNNELISENVQYWINFTHFE